MNKKDVMFLKELQKQMLWEDKHDNDIQASPRFWVIKDYHTVPTHEDFADGHSYYHNDGDFVEFENSEDLIEFIKTHYEEDYRKLVELCLDQYELPEDKIATKMLFGNLWELVMDNLNEDGYYNELPVVTEGYIVPNTLFLTKKEAKDYLKTYGYNHGKKAHTFAMTALRSPSVHDLYKVLHQTDFNDSRSHEDLSKVTYAYGVVSQDYGMVVDLVWEEIEDYSVEILNDWQEYKDIQYIEKKGYLIPYAIRKWEEKLNEIEVMPNDY